MAARTRTTLFSLVLFFWGCISSWVVSFVQDPYRVLVFLALSLFLILTAARSEQNRRSFLILCHSLSICSKQNKVPFNFCECLSMIYPPSDAVNSKSSRIGTQAL
ncbi:hypothetical protein B0T10DRAFT_165590 [Thelonectria olida]|uniref:Uncharacterized protein n=1 Tax=Thelonectria olida TaxID=1576542 RepID=A0A9P8WG26_9HYPO|nr:hypothetical protein B0T10DRAFT_165590 [Thelonectria olida]